MNPLSNKSSLSVSQTRQTSTAAASSVSVGHLYGRGVCRGTAKIYHIRYSPDMHQQQLNDCIIKKIFWLYLSSNSFVSTVLDRIEKDPSLHECVSPFHLVPPPPLAPPARLQFVLWFEEQSGSRRRSPSPLPLHTSSSSTAADANLFGVSHTFQIPLCLAPTCRVAIDFV